jgi:hypothetical protein
LVENLKGRDQAEDIRMDLREMRKEGGKVWRDRDQWRFLAKTVMNLRVL